MRLRPHPPHRPPIPGGAMASTPARASRHERRAFTRLQPRSLESGSGCPKTTDVPRAWSRAFPRRDGMLPFRALACAKLAGACSRGVYPDSLSLGHLLSRDGRVIGWRTDTAGRWSSRSLAVDLPSRRTSPALAKKRRTRGPLRTACSRRPPAERLPLPGDPAGRGELCAIHSRGPHSVARLGWVTGLLAQSAHPGPRAASPASPRRATRSAAPEVPSIEALRSSTTRGLRPEPLPPRMPACAGTRPGPSSLSRAHLGREFSTACHQPVESTRCLFRFST